MRVRTLTDDEYAKLAATLSTTASQLKQVHRLLCDGHKVEDLTPTEQRYAELFKGGTCVQIPNDYGWEPGIAAREDSDETAENPASKPKSEKKK